MPSNLLKIYNQQLELLYGTTHQNLASIRAVFNRDFQNLIQLTFKGMSVKPTAADGEDTMDRLFRHLTTVVVDNATRKREFEADRSIRLHWIKFLIDEKKQNNITLFSIPDEKRIYLLDQDERYVIVFEPLRNGSGIFLLTAYRLEAGRYKSLMTKFEKRGVLGMQL